MWCVQCVYVYTQTHTRRGWADSRVSPGCQTLRRCSLPFAFERVPFVPFSCFPSRPFPTAVFLSLFAFVPSFHYAPFTVDFLLCMVFREPDREAIGRRKGKKKNRRRKKMGKMEKKGMLLGPSLYVGNLFLVIVRRLRLLRDGPPRFTPYGPSPLFFSGRCNRLIFVFTC